MHLYPLYPRGIIGYRGEEGGGGGRGESLLSRSLVPAAHELSSHDRFSIAPLSPRDTPRVSPLVQRPARYIHSAVSSRAMCNDVASVHWPPRGRSGITITCRKLFTNTRPKPKAHMHGGRERRDEARQEGGYRGGHGAWATILDSGRRVKLQQINRVNHPAVGPDFSRWRASSTPADAFLTTGQLLTVPWLFTTDRFKRVLSRGVENELR